MNIHSYVRENIFNRSLISSVLSNKEDIELDQHFILDRSCGGRDDRAALTL